LRVEVMLRLAAVPSARTPGSQSSLRIEGIIESGHGSMLQSRAGDPDRVQSANLQWTCQNNEPGRAANVSLIQCVECRGRKLAPV